MSGDRSYGVEQAVRAMIAQALRADAAVSGAVHQIYEQRAPRMTPPYVHVEGAEGRDWGTKDRPGREVMLTVTLVAGKVAANGAVQAMEAVLDGLRGDAGGWQVIATRILRSRWSEKADGSWQQQMVIRCRCLVQLDRV